jgi:flagellar hook-associated protein 3 FlgL
MPDSDNGAAVFNSIKTGNGTFTATAGAGNTGGGVLGTTTVSNPAAYDGKPFSIQFAVTTAPLTGIVTTTYNILDSTGTVVTPGAPYTSGQAISYDGLQVTLSGQPAAGDTFNVAPSTNQSLFTTVQNLVTALQTGTGSTASQAKLNNSVNAAINNIDQALDHTSTVRSDIGGRLNAITTQLSVSGSQQIQLKSSISTLQSLDYASAITTLNEQNTTMSAAMQAYTLTQGLSLFKFL